MNRISASILVLVLCLAPLTARAEPQAEPQLPTLTMDRAVATALARNRDVIAAKFDIREAELDEIEAGLYPNPVLSYSLNNLVLGAGNPTNAAPSHPGFFSQPVHTIGLSEVIDVWAKRSARKRAAEEGVRYQKLAVEAALREIVYRVRSAFADVAREQSERDLSRETRDRYAETVRLSRARFASGEISSAELGKIELEGLKYENEVIDSEQQYDLARQDLATIMGIGTDLPFQVDFPVPKEEKPSVNVWTTEALARRPDLLAAYEARRFSDAQLSSAKREALPDVTVGVAYTHSTFLVSGDDPNTLGVSASLPLPLFDRNQANIGRAELARQRADNDVARLELEVRREVAAAARRVTRARSLLAVYEEGGMLDRAATALKVAEASYKAGAISLLELLEARRTYIDTRASYIRTQDDYRQSTVEALYAVGGEPK